MNPYRYDEDPPTVRVLRQSSHTARKPHTCTEWGCKRPIEPGQAYRVAVLVEDGFFEVSRVHRSHSHPY